MKYLKFFEQYVSDEEVFDDDPIEELKADIETIELEGTFYHGTAVKGAKELYSSFELGHSIWEAIWVTEDEFIAERFSEDMCANMEEVAVVYEVGVNLDNVCTLDEHSIKELTGHFGVRRSDIRELIPELKEMGYKGWRILGAIGEAHYDDYAIFDLSGIEIKKVKLFIDGQWTDYMELSTAKSMMA